MKFERSHTLEEIADLLNIPFVGPANFPITGLNEIHRVENGDVVFVDHPKYYHKALSSDATVILMDKKVNCPEGKALLISENPFSTFNQLITHF